MSVAAVREPARRLRRFVPAGFRLGRSLYTLGLPAFGLVVTWTMECDAVQLPSAHRRRATISVVAVQLDGPERSTGLATIANMFDLYTVALHTDERHVTRWLREGGMPATTVRSMRMDREADVRVSVPARASGYSLRVNPLHADPVGSHTHANAFWHQDRQGRLARLGLDIPDARDLACIQLPGLCGHIDAAPGSAVAELVGVRRRHFDFVFDHTGLADGSLSLSRP
jgi:hypothetical protein